MRLVVHLRTISAPNAREHWRARATRVAAEREAVRMAWLVAGSPRVPVPGVVTMTRVSPRGLDDDNLRGALKAVRDEVALIAGADDGSRELAWQYAQRSEPRTHAVEIEVR